MRKLGIVALGAAAALTLAGCASGDTGGGSDENATIRVWLVGTDTPDTARDYLVKTFEEEHPGSKLVIEEQAWDGLVDRLTTSLSGSDSPDVVEVGNTQAAAFTSAGAFLDLTDQYDALGGDDLLPGFVEAGTYDASSTPRRSTRARASSSSRRTPWRRPVRPCRPPSTSTSHRRRARHGEPRQVGHLVARSGLAQRAPLHLGERRRGRGAGRRQVGRAAELARVDQGPRRGPEDDADRFGRPEGRERDEPRGRLLRRHHAAALGPELGQVLDPRAGRR